MKKNLFFIFLFFKVSLCCFAQAKFGDISGLIDSFDRHHANFPKEKIYIHSDRSYYSPGDDVWFKGYITLGNFNQLSNLSKVLYVDFVDPQDSLIQTVRLPIIMGVATGDLALSPSLLSGTYRIRAYTNWMRNFGPIYFFDGNIRILHPCGNVGDSGGRQGGDFNNRKIDLVNGFYSLAVNNLLENSLIVELKVDPDKVEGQELNVVIQNEGQLFVAFKVQANKSSNVFNIPRLDIGDGVNEFLVFSNDMQLLARQKVFSLAPSRQLKVQLKANSSSYSTREKVRVDMVVDNGIDSLSKGTFSVSVIHSGKVPDNYEQSGDIISSLLLKPTMDPRSFNYLALKDSDRYVNNTVDSLLKNQFGNEEVCELLFKSKVDFLVEQHLSIAGKVYKNNKKPVANAKVILLSPQSGFLSDTVSDSSGKFRFEPLIFSDSTDFVVQVKAEKGNPSLNITIDDASVPVINRTKRLEEFYPALTRKDELYMFNNRARVDLLNQKRKARQSILLDDVKVEKVRSRNGVRYSSNLNGPGNADQVILAEHLENCISLKSCLQGLLVGITIRDGVPYSLRSPTHPVMIMVDGVFVEQDDLDLVNPFDVETIEILRSVEKLAIYGSSAGSGLLIITMKKGDSRDYTKREFPGIMRISPKGFSLARTFVSPDYSFENSRVLDEDNRSTLYWNPNIVTDSNGKSFFEFYTSDEPGVYMVVIQGMDADGRLGYASLEIEVK